MSYRLSKFGTTALPCARMTATYGTGPTVDATIPVIGGMYDADAAGVGNLDVPYEVTHGCWIVDTEANAQTALEDLYGMRGERRILYRVDEHDLSVHWCWARCTQVRNPWQWQRKTMNPLDITFQLQTPWYGYVHGTGWSLDENYDGSQGLDASLIGGALYWLMNTTTKVITLTNNGNVATRHVSFRFVCGAAYALTALTVAVGNCDIDWTGTLAGTKTLEVTNRPGYCAITNDSVNAYSGFAFGGAHTSGWWLELQSGDNTVTVTRTGGGVDSYINFDWADGWG